MPGFLKITVSVCVYVSAPKLFKLFTTLKPETISTAVQFLYMTHASFSNKARHELLPKKTKVVPRYKNYFHFAMKAVLVSLDISAVF